MDQFPPAPPPPVPQLPESNLAPELDAVPWRAREGIFVAALGIITGLFLSALVAAIIRPHAGSLTDDQRNVLTLAVTALIELSLGVWVWMWVRIRHRRGLKALGFRFRPADVGAGLLAAFVGLIAANIVTQIYISITQRITHHTYHQPKQLPSHLHGAGQLSLAFVAVVVIAPIAEELFFRGFLYQALRKWLGASRGIVFSAAIFAMAHFSPVLIFAIFPLGVVLGFVFDRRGSVVASITTHMTYNLIGFIALVVSAR